MATITHELTDQAVSSLQDLIQINIDSRDGFKQAAEDLKRNNSSLHMMFMNLSDDRAAQARELQAFVAGHEEPKNSGSMAAAAHRVWMDLRSAMGGGDHAILSEAERGEDHIKEKYETALQELAGCDCIGVLQRQYIAVKASHDRVRDLRDSYAKS